MKTLINEDAIQLNNLRNWKNTGKGIAWMISCYEWDYDDYYSDRCCNPNYEDNVW